MGLYDRDYTQADFQSQYHHIPQMRMNFPQITPYVKILLIINISVYFLQLIGLDGFLTSWFSVYPANWAMTLQAWRYITYQFLHENIIHILFNMIGLFFLGPVLERYWGSKRFILFYLGCGMVGGMLYPLLIGINLIAPHPVFGVLPLIGASGSILGLLAACAILFPHFVVFFLFFPIPIRVAAIILLVIATAAILGQGSNAGGEAAHLGGMAAGAIYVFSSSWRKKLRFKPRVGQWEKKMEQERKLQFEVDRILKKVHDHGIHSLTYKEKRILKQATKAEQMRNKY